MKKLVLAGLMVLGAVFGGSPVRAGLTPDLINMCSIGLGVSGTSGSFTFGLNNVTPSVASAAIDMTNYSAMFVQVTASSGTNGVIVQWSTTGVAPWSVAGQIPQGITVPLRKLNNFVQFIAYGNIQPSNISGFTPIKPKISLQYLLVTSSQSVQLAGGTNNIGSVSVTPAAQSLTISQLGRADGDIIAQGAAVTLTAIPWMNFKRFVITAKFDTTVINTLRLEYQPADSTGTSLIGANWNLLAGPNLANGAGIYWGFRINNDGLFGDTPETGTNDGGTSNEGYIGCVPMLNLRIKNQAGAANMTLHALNVFLSSN